MRQADRGGAGMRFAIASALCAVLAAGLLHGAEVSGTVTNGTTGKPQGGVEVSLIQMGQGGMQPDGSASTKPDGTFKLDTKSTGAHLIQLAYKGVTYNQVADLSQPGSLQFTVYESSPEPGLAKMMQHMILLEPAGGQLRVNEVFLYRNSGKSTFNNPTQGTLRFFVPKEAGSDIRVNATAPGGMPVERPAEATKQAQVFKVDYPIRPGGETRFDINYSMPTGEPTRYAGKIIETGGPTRLVAPPGVQLAGDNLMVMGQEPQSQATIYEVTAPQFDVAVQGSGAMPAPSGQQQKEEDAGNGIEQIKPRVFSNLPVICGLGFGILLLGFILLYRRSAPAVLPPAASPVKGGKK
jgi:hypothetical protein